jgi:FtsP/CotA-like multicopper oxidase with cupredoxin domain
VLVRGGSTVRIATDFSNPGTWMVHCHIFEHAERGMMTTVEVVP